MFSIRLTPPGQFSSLLNYTPTGFAIALINLIMVVAAVAFVFSLLIGGLRFILSGGNSDSTKAALRQITGAFIGILIVFGSYALLSLLGNFLGINLFFFRIISVPQAS